MEFAYDHREGRDNTDASLHGKGITFARYLLLQFDDCVLIGRPDVAGDAEDVPKPLLVFRDAQLSSLCYLLGEECMSGEPADSLYGQGLSMAFLAGFSRLAEFKPQNGRGGLSPGQARRVIEYLEANLSRDIALDALADVAGLCRSYFYRAFKSSTGLPPHQWLLRARIERAKRLLKDTMPLVHIAIDLGFADQAHFTRIFTRQSVKARVHGNAQPSVKRSVPVPSKLDLSFYRITTVQKHTHISHPRPGFSNLAEGAVSLKTQKRGLRAMIAGSSRRGAALDWHPGMRRTEMLLLAAMNMVLMSYMESLPFIIQRSLRVRPWDVSEVCQRTRRPHSSVHLR